MEHVVMLLLITPERTLALYNLNTVEKLNTAYWIKGEYLANALSKRLK